MKHPRVGHFEGVHQIFQYRDRYLFSQSEPGGGGAESAEHDRALLHCFAAFASSKLCFACYPSSMEIEFTCQILKEGKTFVAYAPELDVSSCGTSRERARRNLLDAVRLFLEEAEKMGTHDQILEEAGYVRRKQKLKGPKFITAQAVSLPLPLVQARD